MAIIVYALVGWVLAASGTFQLVLALAVGATVVYYAGMCASLTPLRMLRPHADALRIPFGPLLSILAVAISLLLLIGLKRREPLYVRHGPDRGCKLALGKEHRFKLQRKARAEEKPSSLLDTALGGQA